MKRDAKIFIIVGGRGSGKTYFLEHALSPTDTIVFAQFKGERWKGFKQYYIDDFVSNKIGYKQLANHKIVFEDSTSYVNANMTNAMKSIIVNSKQIGCDIYVVFHSLNAVPPFMWYLFSYLILFKSFRPKRTAQNYDYYDEIMRKWNKLNKAKPYKYEVIESNS